MSITAKRQAICDELTNISALAFVPRTITKLAAVNQLPAALVQFTSPSQRVTHTGGYTDNEWTFAVDIIVNGQDENSAVESIESIVGDVLDAQRIDPTFGVFVDSTIEGSGPPRWERVSDDSPNAVPLLVMRLYITGTTEEG